MAEWMIKRWQTGQCDVSVCAHVFKSFWQTSSPWEANVLPYQLELVRETAHLRSNRQVLESGWDAMAQQFLQGCDYFISLQWRSLPRFHHCCLCLTTSLFHGRSKVTGVLGGGGPPREWAILGLRKSISTSPEWLSQLNCRKEFFFPYLMISTATIDCGSKIDFMTGWNPSLKVTLTF